jgi:hypothetical protein
MFHNKAINLVEYYLLVTVVYAENKSSHFFRKFSTKAKKSSKIAIILTDGL